MPTASSTRKPSAPGDWLQEAVGPRNANGKHHAKAVSTRKKDAEGYLTRVQSRVDDGTFRELTPITFAAFAEQ